VLSCKAVSSLTFQPGGHFDLIVSVTPVAGGDLVNPTGGICQIDPDNNIAEDIEGNNICTDNVAVSE
jgi:hypothetical protein